MASASTKPTNPPATKKRVNLGLRNTLVGMSFILPNFLGFAIFILFPVAFSMWLSFNTWDGANPMQFVGFDNFVKIFKETLFRESLVRTLIFSGTTVVLTLFASLGLAILLNKKLKGTNFFRSAIFFPYIASIIAVGVVWNMMLQKDFGPVNEFLKFIGIANPPGWFSSGTKTGNWALVGVIIVYIWKNMGYYMIVYLAALQDIPPELYEAATIDGAGRLQYFWRIAMPSLLPSTFFVLLMLTINSFKSFDLIFALTEGGPGTSTTLLSNYIYNKSFVSWSYGEASAASIILFLIVGTITVLQFRIEKKISQ